MSKTFKAISEHRPPHDKPLDFKEGEQVLIHHRRLPWPALVLVSNFAGARGWIPLRCLSEDRPAAQVVSAFSNKELSVHYGDELTVLQWDEDSHWCLAESLRGQGWVPMSVVGQ